jgi:hypothetical protein
LDDRQERFRVTPNEIVLVTHGEARLQRLHIGAQDNDLQSLCAIEASQQHHVPWLVWFTDKLKLI